MHTGLIQMCACMCIDPDATVHVILIQFQRIDPDATVHVILIQFQRIDPDATVHVILIQFQNYSATDPISNETIRQSILADV